MVFSNWDYFELSWRNPEVPFPSSMLAKYGNKSFKRSEYGSVDNNWSFETIFDRLNFVVF